MYIMLIDLLKMVKTFLIAIYKHLFSTIRKIYKLKKVDLKYIHVGRQCNADNSF